MWDNLPTRQRFYKNNLFPPPEEEASPEVEPTTSKREPSTSEVGWSTFTSKMDLTSKCTCLTAPIDKRILEQYLLEYQPSPCFALKVPVQSLLGQSFMNVYTFNCWSCVINVIVQNHGCQSMWDKFEFGLFDSISRICYSVISSLHLHNCLKLSLHTLMNLALQPLKLCTGTHACRHILNYYIYSC